MYQNYIFDLYGTLIDIHTDEYSKNFYKKYAKYVSKMFFGIFLKRKVTEFQIKKYCICAKISEIFR